MLNFKLGEKQKHRRLIFNGKQPSSRCAVGPLCWWEITFILLYNMYPHIESQTYWVCYSTHICKLKSSGIRVLLTPLLDTLHCLHICHLMLVLLLCRSTQTPDSSIIQPPPLHPPPHLSKDQRASNNPQAELFPLCLLCTFTWS